MWVLALDYCDDEWFALETNRDHSVVFEVASKYCSLDFVDCEGHSISSKSFCPCTKDIVHKGWKNTVIFCGSGGATEDGKEFCQETERRKGTLRQKKYDHRHVFVRQQSLWRDPRQDPDSKEIEVAYEYSFSFFFFFFCSFLKN